MTLTELSSKLVKHGVFTSTDGCMPFLSSLAKGMDPENLNPNQICEIMVRANIQDSNVICTILTEPYQKEIKALTAELKSTKFNLKKANEEYDRFVDELKAIVKAHKNNKTKTSKYDLDLFDLLSDDQKQWYNNIFSILNYFNLCNGVLRKIYNKMDRDYSTNLEGHKIDLIKRYGEEYGKVKCNMLTLIAQDRYLKSIFEPIFKDIIMTQMEQ